MYTVLITTSHHGGTASFRCSCSHTVGVVPKNSHRSTSICHCQSVGVPTSFAAPRLTSYTSSTIANGSQSRTTISIFLRPMLAATRPVAT